MKKLLISSIFIFAIAWTLPVHQAYGQTYYAYVAAESEDKVYQIAYDAESREGRIAETITVGEYPTEIDGPHGITIDNNGEHWYVSIAHGNPYGWLYKYSTDTNRMIAKTELGMFPATMDITRNGLLFVVNFNLHGDMAPSDVSVVDAKSMEVLIEVDSGIMPHGSRISKDDRYQYHVSMMTDELMQIRTSSLELTKRFSLSEMAGYESMEEGHGDTSHHPDPICKPTWADPHPTENLVYVACNGSDEILEIDTRKWNITDRFETGAGPYNLEVSEDGRYLVASYKGEGTTGIWDLRERGEAAKLDNSRSVTHGVSITPDNEFAFVSVEGIGGEAGSVDIIDLEQMELAEVIEVGKQAGGIVFWKLEE